MPYNFAADSFLHKETFLADFSSSEVRFFYGNRPSCVFETPFGDLGATYDDHLRLIGKRVGDFLLALIELFSLCVTAEALRAIIDSVIGGCRKASQPISALLICRKRLTRLTIMLFL